MPIQAPQWTEFLSCPICFNMFDEGHLRPISLGCGHTVCKTCLSKLHQKKCPFDQNIIQRAIDELPVNFALLQLVGVAVPDTQENVTADGLAENVTFYNSAKKCIEELAIYLKPVPSGTTSMPPASSPVPNAPSPILSRPMQRKLVTLVNCQLIEEEGRSRAMRAARSLGERTVTELILQHQNPQQLSANLWAAVRARGCQFLGPAMQEEVLKLILLALEDGSALSRKVLVLFVVQRLEAQYPQASKTAIGHVVQLLYRASCFKVTKREEESSLMQLKEEFRTYEALRREHDAQIVQIATEAGLRISPEQWSSLLYGDTAHKSHMQSIIDKLQTPQSFAQSVSELVIALQRTGDPGNLSRLRTYLELLANVDPSPDAPAPSWENLEAVMKAVKTVVVGLVEFITTRNVHKPDPVPMHNAKYKTSMCRDLAQKGSCPRGANCTFAHSQDEMEKYRAKSKKTTRTNMPTPTQIKPVTSSALTPKEKAELAQVSLSAQAKLLTRGLEGEVSIAGGRTLTHTSTVGQLLGLDERRMCVSVPVVKPSSLPMRTRPLDRPAIYTSPVVEGYATEMKPMLIPAPRRIPPHRQDGPNRPPYHSQIPRDDMVMAPEEEQVYHISQRQHISMESVRSGIGPVAMHYATAETQRKTVSLPPNPYTTENARVPVSMENGRARSPAHQLEDLHSRRKELIAQLNIRKGASIKHAAPQQQSRTSAMPVPPMADPVSSRKANTTVSSALLGSIASDIAVTMSGSLPSSVADSLATTHIGMSLEKHKLDDIGIPSGCGMSSEEEGVVYSSSLPEYIPWSSGSDFSQILAGNPDMPHDIEAVSIDHEKTVLYNSFSDDYLNPTSSAWSLQDHDFSFNQCSLGEDDEFIPYEATTTSKYGPISRGIKVKGKNTGPVQVTADQRKDTTPVTAVTPSHRPYPITAEIPSRFAPPLVHRVPNDHIPDPSGDVIASSLPTAMMRPHLIAAAAHTRGESEPRTLWGIKGKLLDIPASSVPNPGTARVERDQIRYELAHLTKQIHNLQISENDRLARELKAIELNIQETERNIGLAHPDIILAKEAQIHEVRKAEEKQAQECEDRKLAEKLALEEAENGLNLLTED